MIITPLNVDSGILDDLVATLSGLASNGSPVFQSVIVATKKNPPFAQNADQAIIVPAGEKIANSQTNDTRQWVLCDFDVYVQLNCFDWGNLSELGRVKEGNRVENLIKAAIYADRSRGGRCTFYDKDLNGTQVDKMQIIESQAVLKGVIRVRCAYLAMNYQY